MKTRSRKRLEAKYRGQWEARIKLGKSFIIYVGRSRHLNQWSAQYCSIPGSFSHVRPAFKPLIHNGGRP